MKRRHAPVFSAHRLAICALAVTSWLPGMSHADSCLPFLAKGQALQATLVAMRQDGGVDYVPATRMLHLPPLLVPSGSFNAAGGADPEMYKTPTTAQVPTPLFVSERKAPAQGQALEVGRREVVSFTVTVEPQPRVVLARLSHGYAKEKFRASCSADGVLHGATKDADYLLLLHPGGGS